MTEVEIDKSKTSESTNTQGKECVVGRFITEEEGWKIVDVAATWEGTAYKLLGSLSVKGVQGDCSGTTNKIYTEAGFPYPYQSTKTFAAYVQKSHRFRKINTASQKLQAGDILFWDQTHMAIYAPFPEGHSKRDTGVIKRGEKKFNNMYTAFNDRTNKPYGPFNIETFRGDVCEVFRYLKISNSPEC